MPTIFPDSRFENKVILVTGRGESVGFSAIITTNISELKALYNSQCFPLYLYEKQDKAQIDFDDSLSFDEHGYARKEAISNSGLTYFLKAYPDQEISKEDIFYYIYGLLHSPDYREQFADNLSKELPRIPCVREAKDFWLFSEAGRDLAELHINYETVEPYSATIDCGKRSLEQLEAKDFYVTKMKHPKHKVDGKSVNDNSTVIYNSAITVRDIPEEAYEYVVNGKPAIEWVIERQAVTTDKKSGIVNDANDWAIETMNNPKYPLELLLRVITVSLKTNEIVTQLPKLDID